MRRLIALLFLLTLTPLAFSQGGTATPVRTGTALPTSAPISSIFIVNDGTGSIYVCTHSPTCTTPQHWVSVSTGQPAIASLVITPAALPFGSGSTGVPTPAQSITISNTGTIPVTVSNVSFGGSQFSEVNANVCDTTIKPGGVCVDPIQFTAASPGAKTDTLTVISNAPIDPTNPLTVALTGTGTGSSSFALSINCAGAGNGTVISNENPPLINAICTAGVATGVTSNNYVTSSTPILTAASTGNSSFSTYSGGGCGVVNTCTVTVTAATTVSTTFIPPPTTFNVSITGAGAGTVTVTSNASDNVTGQPLNCLSTAGVVTSAGGAGCNGVFNQGTAITFTETPATGSAFTTWSGVLGCGVTSTCALTVNANTTVTASASLTSAPIALTQTVTNATIGATTMALTWASAQPAGDLIVCAGTIPDSTTTVSSIADTTGNTYTQFPTISPKTGTNIQEVGYYSANIAAAAAGANTTTMTLNTSISGLTFSNLTSGNSATPGTGFTTASVTPTGNALVLVTVACRLLSGNGCGAISTITGNSLTYVKVLSKVFGSGEGSGQADTVEVWRGMGASPTAGALTITYTASPTNVSWSVDQVTGTDQTGSNGSGAIGITASNATTLGVAAASPALVTMGTFGNGNNGTYAAFGALGAGTLTVGSGLTQLGQNTNAPALLTGRNNGNLTTLNATYTGTQQWGAIGIEIKIPSNRRDLSCAEYSGILTSSPIDNTGTSNSGTSTTATPGSLTTLVANDLIVNFTATSTSVQTAATSFTQRIKDTLGNTMEDIEGAATGAYNPSDTLSSSGNWVSMQVAFKPSGAPVSTNYSITETPAGNGSGTVTSNIGGLSCVTTNGVISSGPCSISVVSGSTASLTAVPTVGSTLVGYSGITGCSSSATCLIPNITSNQNFTATFALAGVQGYYVTTSGVDSAGTNGRCPTTSTSGCTGGPWATVAYADSRIAVGPGSTCTPTGASWYFSEQAGACVHIGVGTYTTGSHTFTTGGTSESTRVVYVCDTQFGCVYHMNGSNVADFFVTANYWTLAGIDVSATTGTTQQVNLYVLETQGQHTHWIGNKIHDAASGACTGQGGAGIADLNFPDDEWAIGNVVYNMGPQASSTVNPGTIQGSCRTVRGLYIGASHAKIWNNIVYNNAENGIACTHHCTGASIVGNTVFNNGGYGTGNGPWSDGAGGTTATCCGPGTTKGGLGDGITTAADSGQTNSGTTISDNVVINNGAANGKSSSSATPNCGILFASQGGSVTNGLAINNLVVNTQTANPSDASGQACDAAGLAEISQANNTSNTFTGTLSPTCSAAGTCTTLVNYQTDGSGNYQLTSTSPARDSGSTTCAAQGPGGCNPPNDFFGIVRPQGPAVDRGYAEFH